MSWDLVRAWRDRMAVLPPPTNPTSLSDPGLQEIVDVALQSLSNSALHTAACYPGQPYRKAVIVTASTVHTAALEWAAVLLGRGTEVVVKHPSGLPGLLPHWRTLAEGLPFSYTDDRDCLNRADLVIAMGSDHSIAEIREHLPQHITFVPHGHKFSVAWIGGHNMPADPLIPDGFQDGWHSVAADAALHDGRGCLSPTVLFTPLPLQEACERLNKGMTAAATRWPTGQLSNAEHAKIRSRQAITRVVGTVCTGPGYSIHGLPVDHFTPTGLPRSLAVVTVSTVTEAARALAPWKPWLSTVGTDQPSDTECWRQLGASRVCRLGRMQRPPLQRIHDNTDWLANTLKSPTTP